LESRCQTLLTFAPSFPTRPDLTTLFLAEQSTSLGVVQRSPSVVFRRGVHSRAPSTSELVSDSLREEGANPPPCSVLTVSHRLDGLLLHPMVLGSLRTSTPPYRRCARISARFRPWGSPHFSERYVHATLASRAAFPSSFPWCSPALRSLPPEHSGDGRQAGEVSPPLHRGKTSPSSSVARLRVHR
jgi:hypothetical protein